MAARMIRVMQRVVIFSHGFGVQKDDRGLFPDIIAALPDATAIMFDYNEIDEAANALTVTPLDWQADMLRKVVAEAREAEPGATIDLVCHSAGCMVAALAQPEGVRKVICTTPNPTADAIAKVVRWKERLGVEFNPEQTTAIPRKDGSTTLVPPAYWKSLDAVGDVQELYNAYAERTELVIITATQDEVLGDVRFDHLAPNIRIIEMATGHNFEGEARSKLAALIAEELQ